MQFQCTYVLLCVWGVQFQCACVLLWRAACNYEARVGEAGKRHQHQTDDTEAHRMRVKHPMS